MTTKEELLKRLSEVIPEDAKITYASVTFWNEDGTFNYDTDVDKDLKQSSFRTTMIKRDKQ